MNLLAKHEVEHIAFCCDERANNPRRYVAGLNIEIDFEKQKAVVSQKTFGDDDTLCEPLGKTWYSDGKVKRIWAFSFK